MAQEWAKAFYSSKKWIRCRTAYIGSRMLADGGLCEECRDKPGYIVHHKVILTPENISDPEIALNHEHLEYVCKDCHDLFEGHGLRGAAKSRCLFDATGQPVSMREVDRVCIKAGDGTRSQQCYIVYGPPASGKTTFVREHKDKGDLVVDLDYLGQAIGLEKKLEFPDNLFPVVLVIRECLYDLIEKEKIDCKNIWVIAGLPRRSERMALKNRLGAELIFVNASYEECIRRSDADPEREDKQKARNIIAMYFARYEE